MYRLIIADDEENIRNGMANSLPWREWGYEVAAVCASGQEVLDRMEDCRPDVVLSDIRMPGMDGVELMQRLSREYPQVKIVILSGYSDFKYLNMSIRSHVAEYLLKPTDIDDFEETFRRLKAAMDHERLRRAQITESVLRHFHVWLTAMLGGVATPEDTDRFLPMLTEAGIDLDNLQVAAFVLDGHGGDERPDQVALWRRVWEVTAALPAGPLRRLSFLLGGEDMVVLYSSGEEIAPGDVRADIEAIQRAVRDGLRVTLSAGVSDLCTEPGMLPQAYEQANCSAKQSAFAGQEAVYFFSQMQKERPAGMPYFDTEQVEKALLAQDYDALRAEIDRVLLPLAESLPEYRAVDQLCLSLLFHVSLWGLRYGIQMEEVLRALGAHYTDVYQSETLAAKRGFVLACLFGCQQALAARRRSHSHAVKSVAIKAWPCGADDGGLQRHAGQPAHRHRTADGDAAPPPGSGDAGADEPDQPPFPVQHPGVHRLEGGGGRPPGHRQAGLLPGQAVPAEHFGRAVRPPGAGAGTRADVHEHPAQPLRQQGGL